MSQDRSRPAGSDEVVLAVQDDAIEAAADAASTIRLRRRAWLAVGGAAVAVVLAVVPVVWIRSRAPDPSPPLAVMSVIAAYEDDENSYVLNPLSGVYHTVPYEVVDVSPDLLRAASYDVVYSGTLIRIWSTTTGSQLESITVPMKLRSVKWSPDGRWLAGPVDSEVPEDHPEWLKYRSVVVIDLEGGGYRPIDLTLAGKEGALQLWWAGSSQMLITIISGTATQTDRDGLAVMNVDDGILRRVPLPQGQTPRWHPILNRDNTVLLMRTTQGTHELAQLDLAAPDTPVALTRIPQTPPEGDFWTPYAWPTIDHVLFLAATRMPDDPLGFRPTALYEVDLHGGAATRKQFTAPGATKIMVAPAQGLSADAAHLAF